MGSIGGNVTLVANDVYKQVGSDVMAPGGDVTIVAKKVDIVEARETSRSETEQKFKQSGLTLEVTSPILTAAQTMVQMNEAAENTSDGRMKGLAAANTALAAKNAYNAVQAGQNTTGNNPSATTEHSAAEQAGGINLAISIGGSESQSNTTSQSNTAKGSTVTSGGNITIAATGAGQDSNLTIQGSTVEAQRTVQLLADNQINLLAAQNSASQKSTNTSSSGSIGISFGTDGFLINASASKGKGRADGEDTFYTNTQVKAGDKVTITSGGDTTLQGAVVKAEQVKADVGGNLNIASLQDSSTYTSSQQSTGGSVSVGIGKMSASASASKSKIDSNFNSVGEQTGIKAGSGGFQVSVAGNTALLGSVIASDTQAVNAQKNSFRTGGTLSIADIQNVASYSAKSISISAGTNMQPSGQFGMGGMGLGLGSDKGNASSTSSAGISGIAGNTAVRSTDAETGLAKIFDADKVQREITARTQITQAFTREAPKAVASFAASQAAALRVQKNEDEAKKWDEGGIYRIALHTVVGALGGGFDGAVGAGAIASSANLMDALQDGIQQGLVAAGLSDGAAKLLAQGVATLTAAGVGAAVGGAQGAATAATVDANNRQLHPTEAQLIKANAAKYAAQRRISLEQAEAELTQQALRNVDTAHAERLGGSDTQAQTFLKELGAGQSSIDASTGQRFELFSADAVTRTNHAMFGQYVKNNPTVEAALDRAYQSAFKPVGGQTIAGLNGSNAGALTGSDLALNDAARDYRNMRQQPPAVQWSVLGELRQERRENLGTQLKLTQELQDLNSKNDTSPAAALRRGEIFIALIQLDQENTTLRQASVEQLKVMGSNGLLNPADQREWIEGVGEALASGGLGLRGLSAASIAGRLNMLKSAVEEVRASSAAAKAEAQAITTARVENNLGRDGALDPYAPVPNAQAQADLRAKAATDAANGVSNPHYDPKHGPGTTLEQQYQRAMNGINPQTGGNGTPADASKFFNATDMQTAIQRAEAAYAANPPGTFPNGNVAVDFNRPIGEGYVGKTPANLTAGAPVGEYRWTATATATVRIDVPTGKAFTAYPNIGQGIAKPDPLNNGVRP